MSLLSQIITGLLFTACVIVACLMLIEVHIDPWERGWVNVTIVSAVSDQPSYEKSPPNLFVEVEVRASIRCTSVVYANKAPVYEQTLTFQRVYRRDPIFVRLRDAVSDSKPIRGQTVVTALAVTNKREITIILNHLNHVTLIITWYPI